YYFFFFQAEDGIRDYKVTGVQTCALPIWRREAHPVCEERAGQTGARRADHEGEHLRAGDVDAGEPRRHLIVAHRPEPAPDRAARSEERRVGKEWRSRGARDRCKRRNERSE